MKVEKQAVWALLGNGSLTALPTDKGVTVILNMEDYYH